MKRGQAEVWQMDMLIQLIVGILVASVMFASVYNFSYGEEYTKEFVKQDLELMIDTLRAVPDNVILEYPLGKNKLNVDIEPGGFVQVTGSKSMVDLLTQDMNYITIEKNGDCISYRGKCI